MDPNIIHNLQARTRNKLAYAAVMLSDLDKAPAPDQPHFERAHTEAFLFHLHSALDAFLAEMNIYYDCGLDREEIRLGNLREKIQASRGANAVELRELWELQNTAGSWLRDSKAMRDHCTHGDGVPHCFYLHNADLVKTTLRNPATGLEFDEELRVLLRRWLDEASATIDRWRASALATTARAA